MSITFKVDYSQVDRSSSEYLSQLLNDKKQLQIFPNVFIHLEKILDEEITRVRQSLLQLNSGNNKDLPEPHGPVVSLSEKLMVPVSDYPDYNFVGRILGPRGMTVKQLEIDTGCKIMVRGKGSMRDRQKEDMNRTKPNWEHLNEDLHVLITCDDTENRAHFKINRAKEEVKKLLIPTPDGEDNLKRRQLVELALINGTYRDTSTSAVVAAPASFASTSVVPALPMSQTPHVLASSQITALPTVLAASSIQGGARLILAPRLAPSFSSVAPLSAAAAGTPTLIGASAATSILPAAAADAAAAGSLLYPYSPYLSPLVDYTAAAAGLERSSAGAIRRPVAYREHPYAR